MLSKMSEPMQIPQIAITLESSDNNHHHVHNNFAENLTDIEDLDNGDEMKKVKKSKLKVKLTDDGALTDLEDFDASDDDEISNNVQSPEISLNDLKLEFYNSEETVKGGSNSKSLSEKSPDFLRFDDVDGGLTDAENFDTDDESEDVTPPEANINLDEYCDFVESISSEMKPAISSPINNIHLTFPVLDASQLTDIESIQSEDESENLAKKCKSKKKKGKCYKVKDTRTDVEDIVISGDEKRSKRSGKLKKSMSHPFGFNHHHHQWNFFDSDGDDKNPTPKFPICKKVITRVGRHIQTDVEDMTVDDSKPLKNPSNYRKSGYNKKCHKIADFIKVEEKQQLIQTKAKPDSNESSTDEEFFEGAAEEPAEIMTCTLPQQVRTLVVLNEDKSIMPTTRISPLKENPVGLTVDAIDDCPTDTECFNDEDFLGVEDEFIRGPTPDIGGYEGTCIIYGKIQSDPIEQSGVESMTDSEDIADVEQILKTVKLPVIDNQDYPITDTEDLDISTVSKKSILIRQDSMENLTDVEQFDTDDEDFARVTNLRARPFSPFLYYLIDSGIIASKDAEGSMTTKNRLGVVENFTPNLTDAEDLQASSDDEDSANRFEAATPNEFSKQLNQQRSSKIHIESSRKLNLDSPIETMYLKGGFHRQNLTDVEDISDFDDNGVRFNLKEGSVCYGPPKQEWDVSKKSAPTTEASDAGQQARPNFVTYESVLLKSDCDMPISPLKTSPSTSYTQIDAMLEKMLFEVERQEKLFSLDLDVLESKDDSYVNTLELVPETDALIEIPVKKTAMYESVREIQIDQSNEGCILASSESLADDYSPNLPEHDYEPIEYNPLTHAYQRFDSTYPKRDIWFEGTYRNLSIVPEEDEDESQSLLSNYSNYRSLSSNRYSYYDSSTTKEPETDSSDTESTDPSDFDDGYEKFESIVKAEVKLLVKTTERGKEAIEIRSVREFLENPIEKETFLDKLKQKFIHTKPKRRLNQTASESSEDLLKDDRLKPSFTLPQVFVRTPELPESNLQETSKRFGSRTELLAANAERFPLEYDPEAPLNDEEVLREIGRVDLHANIPFFPCYNRSNLSQYGFKPITTHTNPFTETISNPFSDCDFVQRAYCDWYDEEAAGGLPTTTEHFVDSNEELDKPVGQSLTGLSIIDDRLIIDLDTVLDQTNAFIQSESQPEPYDVLAEKYNKKEPVNEKKIDDNKNNANELKKKSKKGFFGSIKTFVEKSFESDSESEKSPKKGKKDKKKKKKDNLEKTDDVGLPPRKPKLPTPPLDVDNIPFVEGSLSEPPPPYSPPEIPEPITTDLDVVVEKSPPKPLEVEVKQSSPKKKSKAKTVVVQEVTKRIEPLVIEAEEFSIVVDPTRKESPKKSKETFTINIDESIEKIEREILEKSPILPEEKIMKPLVDLEAEIPVRPLRSPEPVYEDVGQPVLSLPPDHVKNITSGLIENEINFGAWADDHHHVSYKPTISEEIIEKVDKEIIEKQDRELSKEKDVVKKKEEKKSGFFGLFKRKESKKDEEAIVEPIKPVLAESVIRDMQDSDQFLTGEVEHYHDVRPIVPVAQEIVPDVEEIKSETSGLLGFFKKSKKDEHPALSEEVLKDMTDTRGFLKDEVDNYHDVKPEVAPKEEIKVTSPKSGVIGKFKKSKKDDEAALAESIAQEKKLTLDESATVSVPSVEKPQLSVTVLKDMAESSQFLLDEIQNYHDVKPIIQQTKEEVVKESIEEPSSGFFGLFKKSKKDEDDLNKIEIVEHETDDKAHKVESREASPRPSSGFFGLFKKSKKDEEETTEAKPVLSEVALKDMADTRQFLNDEVEKYHDVKPEKFDLIAEKSEEIIVVQSPPKTSRGLFGIFKKSKDDEVEEIAQQIGKEIEIKVTKPIEEESSPKPSRGLFSIFKKSTKDEEEFEVKPNETDEVIKIIIETNQFLYDEVENYHDVKPEKFPQIIEEVTTKTSEVVSEASPKPSRGLFGLFKKSKDDKDEVVEEVVRDIKSTTELTHEKKDIKPAKGAAEEICESSPKSSRGLFGIFKISKDEKELPQEVILSEAALKDMTDTKQFLIDEVDKYHDVKPEKFQPVLEHTERRTEEIIVESSPKSSRGLFGIFKKSKKEDEASEEMIKTINDTNQFIEGEVEKSHDIKPKVTSTVGKEISKVVEEVVETSPKTSRGLLGMFKKSKKEEEESPEKKIVLSEETVKNMTDTTQFLQDETDNYHDVKPIVTSAVEKQVTKVVEEVVETSPKTSRGLLGMFKKSKKEEEESPEKKIILSEETVKDMTDTTQFLQDEVENYHDVKPIVTSPTEKEVSKVVEEVVETSPKTSRGLLGMFKKSKKEEEESPEKKIALSEETVKKMTDTTKFLQDEVQNYHDVKPIVTSAIETEATKVVEEVVETSPKTSRGLFGIFKKSKKEEEESPEKKIVLSEETVKNMTDTTQFLQDEVENYHDAKPKVTSAIEKETSKIIEEVAETSPKTSRGLFGLFKKTKKEEEESPEKKIVLSEGTVKDMSDTTQFLKDEVENYHDVKPEVPLTTTEEKIVEIHKDMKESSPKPPSSGIFGLFKKSKKDDETQPTLSEEVIKDMKDTKHFLHGEVKHYHDAKPEDIPTTIEEKMIKTGEYVRESSPKPPSGIFGIFKKLTSEDDEEEPIEVKPSLSEAAIEDMCATRQFLMDEVENYCDVRPIIKQQEKVEVEVEKPHPKQEAKGGFLSKFKKSKKKSITEPQISVEVLKEMDDTRQFLQTENENYEDGKITKTPKKDEKFVTFEESTIIPEDLQKLPTSVIEVKTKIIDSSDIVLEKAEDLQETSSDVIKDLETKIEGTIDVTLKEVDDTGKEIVEEKPSKKDKHGKEKKGIFNIFGKKAKSQDSTIDESRTKSIDESEGSPKKQKRRKSSSPFKFFEKMKKSEERELEAPIETKPVEEPPKDATEELINMDIEEPNNLSEEVLKSLDEKLQQLKGEYSKEAQKSINDCRDFLFIEVDNYEDAQPVIVTDIDKDLSDWPQGLKQTLTSTIEVISQDLDEKGESELYLIDTSESIQGLPEGIVEIVQKTEETLTVLEEEPVKTSKKTEKKTGGFFSKLGNLISGTVEDTKSDLKGAKVASEKVISKTKESAKSKTEKTVGIASKGVEDIQELTKSKLDRAAEGLDKTKEDLKSTTQKIAEDTAKAAGGLKDAAVDEFDHLKGKAGESTDKVAHSVDKIKDEVIDASVRETEEVKIGLQTFADQTESAAKQVEETTVKKIKDAEDKVVDFTTKKVEEMEQSKAKIVGGVSKQVDDAKQEIVTTVDEAKEVVKGAKEISVKKIDDVRDSTAAALDKTKTDTVGLQDKLFEYTSCKIDDFQKGKDEIIDSAAQKVEDTKRKTQESVMEVKESTVKKIEDVKEVTAGAIDGAISRAVEAEGSLINYSAAKVEEAHKSKDEAARKIDDVKEKVVDQTKESIKENREVVLEKLEGAAKAIDKTKTGVLEAQDHILDFTTTKMEAAKDSIKDTKEATVKKIEEAKEDAAQKLGDAKEKVVMTVDKTKESLKDAKETTVKKVDEAKEITLKKVQDTKASIEATVDETKKSAKKIEEATVEKIADIKGKTDELIDEKRSDVLEVKDKFVDYTTTQLHQAGKSKDDLIEGAIKKADETKEEVGAAVVKGKETIKDAKEDAAEKLKDTIKVIDETKPGIVEAKDELLGFAAIKIDDAQRSKDEAIESVAKKVEDTKEQVAASIDKTKESVKDATVKKINEAKESATRKIDDAEEKLAATTDKTKGLIEEAKEITAKKIEAKEETIKSATRKIEDAKKKVEETVGEAKSAVVDVKDKAIDTTSKKVDDVKSDLQTTIDKSQEVIADVKHDTAKKVHDIHEETEVKLKNIEDGSKKIKEEISTNLAEKLDDFHKTKDSVKIEVMGKTKSAAQQLLEDATKKLDELERAKDITITKSSAKIADVKEETKKSMEATSKKMDDKLHKTEEIAQETTTKIIDDAAKIIHDIKHDAQIATGQFEEKVEDAGVGKVNDKVKEVKDEIIKNGKDAVIHKKDDAQEAAKRKLVDFTSTTEEAIGDQAKSLTDSLSKGVKSYVTSPTMARRAESQRYTSDERPAVREITSSYFEVDSDEEMYTVTEPEESEEEIKRKPLFHLESEDDDSLDTVLKRRDSVKSNVLETLSENKLDNLLSNLESQLVLDLEKSRTDIDSGKERKVSEAEEELETIKKDSQADVEQIEQKLRDLDKALDSLEQATEPNQQQLAKKLHRVERKFERMASEVLEEAAAIEDVVSPTEVEARREHEFQRLVSQLSTEEVSDFQKEYSHLWDETTFSKSDDWDSKTPDSDVLDLPQGEVVYLGPVTLNRDNLVNKAGIEVDVIPIMKSPVHSPKPTRKKNKRAKSAMDFYESTNLLLPEFDRGSLPDLKRSPLKGRISTIVGKDPDRFLYGSMTSLAESSSASDLSKGEIMSAVLDWLDNKTTSLDSGSVASSDSNLSHTTRTKGTVPTIVVSHGKKRPKGRETTCAPTLIEETKPIPQPKPRFAKDTTTDLQFKQETDVATPPAKQISPVRDDLLDDDNATIPETYSDKKKFWESVTKDSTTTKRMSLHEISTSEKEVVKKRASIHEFGTIPIPKPRSVVQVSHSIDETTTVKTKPLVDVEEEEDDRIMTEYQASFLPPAEMKRKSPPKIESDKDSSTDSESDAVISGTNENVGYISDSGDVEHYISDSEIEDRVPQIRERQMSVFQPPVAAARKTIYERSASLPTEDLYEVSARSIKLRKQYYEEQIKKEMIEEQLTSEIEEEPSPERKTLLSYSNEDKHKDGSVDEIHDIKDFMEVVDKKEVSFDETTHKTYKYTEDQAAISQQQPIQETHKEIDLESQTKRSSVGSEQSTSSEMDRITTSKPDSMEVHVDKSEIEDSEKLAELDQDATDIETKSLDSLNATEISPKSSYMTEEPIPEITVTLSGKQRRISEESDEYAPKAEKKQELDSPINVPEEHVEDTVWEVSVQSQPCIDEKVTSFEAAPSLEKIEKEEDLSISTRDESDLGSEIHQDHSDSYASDKIKSDSHSDIERIIMDSLQHQKVDPIEAKAIASALIEEIEAEIQKRECLPISQQTTSDVKDYLKYLAETKGLDEREVELVESVLARRHRELAKLSRGDTQASSIEITDEDLRYSGTEIDSSNLILEQQISQLKAEKVDDIKSMAFMDKIDEKKSEEQHFSKDYESSDDGVLTSFKSDLHTKTYDTVKGEKSEAKDVIFEEDETISESISQEKEVVESKVEAVATEESHHKTEDREIAEIRKSVIDVHKENLTDITAKTTQIDAEDSITRKTEDVIQSSHLIKSDIKHEIDLKEKKIDGDVVLKGEITCEDLLKKEETCRKEVTTHVKELEDGGILEKEQAKEETHTKTMHKEVLGEEVEKTHSDKDVDSTTKQTKISTTTTSVDVHHESSTSSETKEKIETVSIDPNLLTGPLGEVKTIVEKHEEIKRTSSSESKSSIESGKSPDDQFSSCSSGRKGDSDTSKVTDKPEVHLRKASSMQKADRKSGIDFEAYSSSGESHYHSFELDSGKSRPCSSDVEGLVAAAGSSEYESALTSQDYSARSHVTSTEYHTAVSSLSSKESMKSLDSESSGHLGSVEVSELSETLVPSTSDIEGDMLDQLDDTAWQEEQVEIIEEEPVDKQSKMKRSYEMTFQPEPKILTTESPQADESDRKFTSMDESSVVSMSLSSTSGTTEPRTVIELSRADSERIEGGSMTVSGTSELEGSCDSLIFHPTTTTTDISTSTGIIDFNTQIESITITTSMVNENGIRSVSTQVISETHTPEEIAGKIMEDVQQNGSCYAEMKKKGHRRQESTSFIPTTTVLTGIKSELEQKIGIHSSELTESDKYTAELSFKEVSSDEKKDIDEKEKEESYETEADQGFHRDVREGKYHEADDEIKDDTPEFSSETQASVGELEQEYTSALARTQQRKSDVDLSIHKESLEKRDSHGKSSTTSSEKSSFEEAEAEAAFNMVAHVSPAHKIKQICPILEDADAEKHELETRERAQKEFEKRRAQIIRDQSPGSIPDIKVTQHMTPLVDRNFRYPDLELEEKERQKEKETTEKSTPQTPSSKSSEDTDQGREYILEDSGISIPEEATTDSRSTVIEQTIKEEADKDTDSPNSDSFEMLEKPDLIDDFVVIEEVAKEAQEFDSEGKSVSIEKTSKKLKKKHDEEVEAYLVKSAPTPLTRMTDVKFYPDGSSSDELGFEFEDSPPVNQDGTTSYDKELEANKKWIEQQFQGDQAARMAAGYDYEMDFERGPLEDIKEEDINDFDPTSSRIGSLGSQKESGGSLGSVKDSYSSTPEYDVLAGRKYFTRSGEHDDVSMSSLQEFETLERAMSLETKRYHQGSQDSSSNGSFKTRYYASKSGQGDDVSMSSLKEFEGLEMACIAAHTVEVKAKEEEAMLAQIDEGQESLASESESCETVSRTDKKLIPDSDEEDYEKRMFEIDEIIRQAQTNVERFVDLKEGDKTESLGRGDSIEEVSKVPDLDLDAPLVRSNIKVQWKDGDDVMVTSTDSIDGKIGEKGSQHDSTDSLDQNQTGADIMTASTDSIEFQSKKTEPINLLSDSIEIKDEACGMVSSDSLELGFKPNEAMLESTDSLDPTSSTATHATYQYETDSVFSGSFTSGGSNTMVSSTDTIDPVQMVDIAAAARKVWFDEQGGFSSEVLADSSKPYVTEVIEPLDEEGFSHTIHRRVEMPAEIRKVTFYGSDADERLKQFIDEFNEGEQIEETEEVDEVGNVHTKRVVHRRFVLKGEEPKTGSMEEFVKSSLASKTNQLIKETTGDEAGSSSTVHESPLKVQASRRRQLRYEISVDDQIEVDPREHDWRFNLPEHVEEAAADGQADQGARSVADQHQLSDEMKELLMELERESEQ